MSEEQVQEAPPQEAPEMEAPAQVEAQQEYAPQEHNPQQEQGFSSPYEAFSHLPEFQGQDDLTIARNLYGAYNGLQESQRQLQQYQQVVP